jgi:hypothetical protein
LSALNRWQRMTATRTLPAALLVCLAGCTEPAPAPVPQEPARAEAPSPAAPSPPAAPEAAPAPNVLTLGGLGHLRIEEAVPASSGWAERGAQISDECRTVSSPDFPGVYAIVEDGKVRRITIGKPSGVRLAEGIRVGSSEAEVRAAFPNLSADPHEYVDPPGKYLTASEAANGDPALRFEIGADGKVSLIHAGTMPVLGYVEGCA